MHCTSWLELGHLPLTGPQPVGPEASVFMIVFSTSLHRQSSQRSERGTCLGLGVAVSSGRTDSKLQAAPRKIAGGLEHKNTIATEHLLRSWLQAQAAQADQTVRASWILPGVQPQAFQE